MKNKIIGLVLIVVLCLMTLCILFLVVERTERNIEIDELNKKMNSSDSLSRIKIEKLNSIIDRKNSIIDTLNSNNESVNGFMMGERSISTEELLKIVNEAIEENSKLKTEVKNDKLILKHIENSYGLKAVIDSLGVINLKLNPGSSIKDFEKKSNDRYNKVNDELQELKFILNNLQKRYGFKYQVKTEGNKINSTIYTTKLDSALWLYPHYKHKIKQDKEGNVLIK